MHELQYASREKGRVENSAVGRAAAFGTVTTIRREAEGAAALGRVCSREMFEERPFHSEKSSNKCTTALRETRLALTPFAVSWDLEGSKADPITKIAVDDARGAAIRAIIEGRVRCVRSRPRGPAALPCW